MARLLVTRAMPEAEETAGEIFRRGHEPILAPLRTTNLLDGAPPAKPDALIATSANALRAPFPQGWTDLPLHCVGEATARAADDMGFRDIWIADGDVRSLLAALHPRPGERFVYLAGEPRRDDIETCFAREQLIAHLDIWLRYRMIRAEKLPDVVRQAFDRGDCDAILHFSSESAEALFALAEAAGCLDAALTPVQGCLSAAIADTVKGWGQKRGISLDIAVADMRTGAALIETTLRRCGAPGGDASK